MSSSVRAHEFLTIHLLHHAFGDDLCCEVIAEQGEDFPFDPRSLLLPGEVVLDGRPIILRLNRAVTGERHETQLGRRLQCPLVASFPCLGTVRDDAAHDAGEKADHVHMPRTLPVAKRTGEGLLQEILGLNWTIAAEGVGDLAQACPARLRQCTDRGGDLVRQQMRDRGLAGRHGPTALP